MTTLQSPGPVVPIDPGERIVNGRRILKVQGRDGWPVWHAITTKRVATYSSFQDGSGKPGFVERDEIAFTWSSDPGPLIQSLLEMSNLRPFDPRPENRLADQLEQARAAGFNELVDAFSMAAKVKPREPAPAMLGEVWLSHGVSAKLGLGRELILGYLKRHQENDWGVNGRLADQPELDGDRAWCPPVWGVATENQAAVLANRGLVQSVYVEKMVPTRGPEELRICTLLGQTTVIYSRLDCV